MSRLIAAPIGRSSVVVGKAILAFALGDLDDGPDRLNQILDGRRLGSVIGRRGSCG